MRAAEPADDVPIPELLGAARAALSTDSRLLVAGASQLNVWVRRETNSGTNLKSLALGGASALWALAAVRGHWLPEAVTLFWYALSMAANGSDRAASHVSPPQRQDATDKAS